MPRGAVIIGGFVNGLGLVGALAARAVPCAVVTTKPYDVAQYSRWVRGHAAVSGLEDDPDVLLEALERRVADWRGWALFPTNDESLAALAIHGERLRALG
ncbi:MAG: hypothetical protein FJ144_23020 [Deltaproteobacteria bacterium]|nr:hypothetical protein [Deltaproteobacteria bacterium]